MEPDANRCQPSKSGAFTTSHRLRMMCQRQPPAQIIQNLREVLMFEYTGHTTHPCMSPNNSQDHSTTLSAHAHQEQQVKSMSGAPSRWLGSPPSLSCESGTSVNESPRGPVIPDVWCYARGVTTRVTPFTARVATGSLHTSIMESPLQARIPLRGQIPGLAADAAIRLENEVGVDCKS